MIRMEFDARVKEPDKVAFECTVVMPAPEDSDESEQRVTLKFRDFATVPGRISIDHMRDDEAQLWGTLQWGLIEPKCWPLDKPDSLVLNLFRQLPQHVTLKIHRAWQKASGVTLGESSASTNSSESTETS